MSTQEKRDGSLLAVVPLLALAALNGAWIAFVVHKLYGWYAVPLGAPQVSWAETWGLILLLGAVVYTSWWPKVQEGWRASLSLMFARATSYALMLLFGWLIKIWWL